MTNLPYTHLTPSSPRTDKGRKFRPVNPYIYIMASNVPTDHSKFEKEYGHLLFHCTNPPDNDEPIEVGRCEFWWQMKAGKEYVDLSSSWVPDKISPGYLKLSFRQSFRIKDEAEQKVCGKNCGCKTEDECYFEHISTMKGMAIPATDKAPVSVEETIKDVAVGVIMKWNNSNRLIDEATVLDAVLEGANWQKQQSDKENTLLHRLTDEELLCVIEDEQRNEQQRIIGVIEALDGFINMCYGGATKEQVDELRIAAEKAIKGYKNGK